MSEHNTRPSQPRDHATLMALAERLGKPLYTLHVMASNTDPFLAGMRARLRDAQWFAKVWNDLGAKRGFHLRRLHYLVVSQDPPVLLPDGTPYINTQRCAAILYDAGRDARHLGLVDADDLVDRKNPAPRVYLQEGKPSEIVCQGGLGDMSPTLEIPCLRLAAPIIAQPYQVELWCEKSTMDDILDPLGQRYGVNVQTGTGELSLTHCVGLVRRAQASGLPVRILYISDFDPAGAGMPLAVARKIEHILYREELYDLDIQVRPIVLTHDQCVEYRLPRSPIKESETRAGPFEERFGEGATELDAFEALHPGELERILVKEIERYYDTSLDAAAEDTAADVQSDLDALNREVHAAHARGIAKLKRERKKALAAIRAFKRKANPILRKIQNDLDAQVPDVDLYDWPAPEEGDEDPDPMFDSARTYLEQIDRYKQHQGKSSELSLLRSARNSHVPVSSAVNLSNPVALMLGPAVLSVARIFGGSLWGESGNRLHAPAAAKVSRLHAPAQHTVPIDAKVKCGREGVAPSGSYLCSCFRSAEGTTQGGAGEATADLQSVFTAAGWPPAMKRLSLARRTPSAGWWRADFLFSLKFPFLHNTLEAG